MNTRAVPSFPPSVSSSSSHLAWIVAVLVLAASCPAMALEPPRPSEIEQLRQAGQGAERLERARALGNHRIDRDRLEGAIQKARRHALGQQGSLAAPEALPVLPPANRLMPTTGDVRVFALLIDFLDYPAYSTQAAVHSALFGDGSLIPSNPFPYESLRNFYARSSYGQLDLSSGVTVGWYHAPYDRASVPQTWDGREGLIKEAIAAFDAAVDFSQFDNDGDGQIEYFIVIWTGPNNGWANFWWGYQTGFGDQAYTVDGKRLGKYSWQWEGSYGIHGPFDPRTVIHETGHGLGLPDYYDYDAAVGPDGGVGGLDMMAGSWGDHNAFSKWVLDWITPTVVPSGSQTLTLGPSGTSPDAVLVMPGATASDAFREFFMAQNRYRVGNDPPDYPADGMLLWHVDARLDPGGTHFRYDNSFTAHKLLKLMEADGLERIEQLSAWADAAMYYTAGKALTPTSTPSSRDYVGVDSRVNVTAISQPGPHMTATFSIDDPSTLATLTVARAGDGSGTVSVDAGGIACGQDCAESYVPGTVVTLSAVPAPGSKFLGWSGGGCSGVGSCPLTMSEDTAVTATFDTTVVLHEEFASGALPAGWATVITTGQGWWWFDWTSNPTGGLSYSALGAPYGTGPFDIALHTRTMDLSAFDHVGLEFKTDIGAAESTAHVDVSVNGGSTWSTVWQAVGRLAGPQTITVDLSARTAGRTGVMLRFRTFGTWVWWTLDDIEVTAYGTLPVPRVMSFAINGGAASTTSPVVTLNNTASGDPTEYQASESSTFAGAPWLPYSTAPSFTLSAGNKAKTVYFRVRNADGAPSLRRYDTIMLNVPTPAVSAFAINGGATVATSRVVTLHNTATGDPIEYQASESSTFAGAPWLPYSTAPSFTLGPANGTKRVYFRVRNAALTVSTPARSDTITLKAPVPTVSAFAINGGATTTTSRVVTLNITATGGPTEYQASESSTFAGAAWLPYATAPSFTLSALDGVKRVYVRVRNADLMVSPSRSDTITLRQ